MMTRLMKKRINRNNKSGSESVQILSEVFSNKCMDGFGNMEMAFFS